MLAGARKSEESELGKRLREQLRLKDVPPEFFHYLNQSGCVSDPTIDDDGDFDKVCIYV